MLAILGCFGCDGVMRTAMVTAEPYRGARAVRFVRAGQYLHVTASQFAPEEKRVHGRLEDGWISLEAQDDLQSLLPGFCASAHKAMCAGSSV